MNVVAGCGGGAGRGRVAASGTGAEGMSRMNAVLRLSVVVLALSLAAPAGAQTDTPSGIIDRVNAALLQAMENADALGFEGRYEALAPVLSDAFDFSGMSQVMIGAETWRTLTPEQKQRLVDAFARLAITSYAARFDGYSGERFEIEGEQQTPRGGVVVRSRIVRPADDPVDLDFVFRDAGGRWRIIDVLLGGTVSELSTRRSEYGAVLARQGFDGLIAEIERAIARLRAPA